MLKFYNNAASFMKYSLRYKKNVSDVQFILLFDVYICKLYNFAIIYKHLRVQKKVYQESFWIWRKSADIMAINICIEPYGRRKFLAMKNEKRNKKTCGLDMKNSVCQFIFLTHRSFSAILSSRSLHRSWRTDWCNWHRLWKISLFMKFHNEM